MESSNELSIYRDIDLLLALKDEDSFRTSLRHGGVPAVTVPVVQSIARKIRKVVFSSDFKRRRGDSEWLNIL